MTSESARYLLVDTSAFYAHLDPSDQWHHYATAGFQELADRNAVLITTNLVIAETHQLAFQRLGLRAARIWIDLLQDFNIRFQTAEEHQRTTEILRSPIGPHLSYVDAASIATMESASLSTIFSFDSDFATAGFNLFPNHFRQAR